MTTDRKIRANRANAQASTGPKTARGGARAARNALRHGLSVCICSDPVLCKTVETLAHQIVGADATPEIQEPSRRIAEAQLDLRRIRWARHCLLNSALCDPDYDPPTSRSSKTKLLGKAEEFRAEDPRHRPDGPQKFATILSDMCKQLAAMDRYERRALSRRKFAIRAFDAARTRVGTSAS